MIDYKPGPIGKGNNRRQVSTNHEQQFIDDELTTEESDESKSKVI
jgi:hypothetical protein